MTQIRNPRDKNIQDRRTPGQRDYQRAKEKFPQVFPKPAPGIDSTAKLRVPYARVPKPSSKKYAWTPSDKVPGYGPGGKGGIWQDKRTGNVVGTSKSPTARPTRVKPQAGPPLPARNRNPKPPLNTGQRATRAANPGLYPTKPKKKGRSR